MLKLFKTIATGATIGATLVASGQALGQEDAVQSSFETNGEFAFTDEQKAHIDRVLKQSHARVAEIYPEVADTVHVTVLPVVRPALDPLGGVTGRAERPDELVIEFSQTYPDGIDGAVDDGLAVDDFP